MTDQWREIRLGDVALVSTGPFGSLLHKSDYTRHGVPLVNPINIQDERIVPDPAKLISEATKKRLSNYILEVGDVVVARRGEIGRCAVVGPHESGWICGTGSFFVRPLRGLDPHFLANLLRSDAYRQKLEAASTGATMSNLSNKVLGDLSVSVPPLPEQQRIVAILDEAFEGIGTAVANAEKSLANALGLFESFLGQIDGKKESLGNLVDIRTGKLDANAAVQGGKYPFFTCSRQVFAIDEFAFDCEAILLAGNNAVGDFNVKHYRGKFNAYQRTYVITTNQQKRVSYRFLYFQMRRSLKAFKAQSVGAGTKFLKLDMIKNMEIVLPPVGDQARLASQMDLLLENTERLEAIYRQKIDTLAELKQTILQKAFAGALPARFAEAVPEAAE